MSPPIFIVLALAILFGGLGSILMIVSSATDQWEISTWDSDLIKNVEGVNLSESYFNDAEGYYKVVVTSVEDGDGETVRKFYLRSMYGGIWWICDNVGDELRNSAVYKESEDIETMRYGCLYYITDLANLHETLDVTGQDLERMQNSAASCIIVSILCLLTAAIIGGISIWQKQVSACMVTGVMYVVSGVFGVFGVVIVMTKLSYMRNDCYSLDRGIQNNKELCHTRVISMGWSVPIAWVSFVCFLLSATFWCFLSRCLRLEKTKSMI